jgi:hypothetical protein
LLAAMLLITAAAPARAQDELSADAVRNAIKRGIEYLKQEQSPRGDWMEYAGYPGGVSALCTLAMLEAGVPPDDPHIKSALEALRKLPPKQTYVTSLQTMVLCAAEPKRDLVQIRINVRWLEDTQIKDGPYKGAWSYPATGRGDNSNSQFALLALHAAERVGVEVSDQTWRRAYAYWKKAQNPDGSWGYVADSSGTGSMTCAGIASMVIASGKITPPDASVEDGRVQCCGEQEKNDAIERGLQWLGRNFTVNGNPNSNLDNWEYYYLYALERVGRMTAHRYIGEHDWYREGAQKFVREQDELTGFWKGSSRVEQQPLIGTSMALLFLAKGRRPVLIAKLKHGAANDWNHHRNDLAHLTAFTEKRWERDLTWQIIQGDAAKTEDLLQTPVLFINGSDSLDFSDEQKKRLREYLDRGGSLFASASCGGEAFDRGFRQLMQDIFPESEYRLRVLPPSHPVWFAEEPVAPDPDFPLLGVDYGCRTAVIYCPGDLSCYWELFHAGRATEYPAAVAKKIETAMAIGVNALTYFTGRDPKYKDEIPRYIELDGADVEDGLRGTLYVANLKHPGGCEAAPGALVNLLRAAAEKLKLRVSAADRQIAITDESLFKHHLVFMHGRRQFTLTPDERDALRTYLKRGGTIFADAICANAEFAESFRREMQAILPDKKLERVPDDDPIFTPEYGGYDIQKVTRRDPTARVPGQPLEAQLRTVAPTLEAVTLDGRYAVIFSPYDISCALEKHVTLECNGYTPEDAAKIGLNVLLYSLNQ